MMHFSTIGFIEEGQRLMALHEEKTAAESGGDFDTLVEEQTDFVYNVAYRMMGNPQDAEDVVQDAFLSAYRAWDRFRGEARPSTWLYRITVNAALMRLRKNKKSSQVTQLGLDDVEIVDWSQVPERGAVNSELGDRLWEGIGLLAPDLKAAVVMRDVEGLSNTEAADALEISVSALKSRLHRARVILRQHLSEYLSNAGPCPEDTQGSRLRTET